MTRHLLLCLLAALGAAGHPACSRKPPETSGRPPRFRLTLRYAPGGYVITCRQRVVQTGVGEGATPPLEEEMRLTARLEVAEPGDDGRSRAVLTFARVRLRSGALEADSDEVAPAAPREVAAPREALRRLARKLLEARLVVVFGPDGRIERLGGFETLAESLAAARPEGGPFLSPLQDLLGETALRQMVAFAEALLPSRPVGAGATWTVTTRRKVDLLGEVMQRTKCKLVRLDESKKGMQALVRFEGRLTARGAAPTALAGTKVRIVRLELHRRGRFRLNADTGLPGGFRLKQRGMVETRLATPLSETGTVVSRIETETECAVRRAADR